MTLSTLDLALTRESGLMHSVIVADREENDFNQIFKSFVQFFAQVSNTRLDLLYRFYNIESKLFVSETLHNRKRPIDICAKGQQEIRYLLLHMLSSVRHKLVNAVYQKKSREQTLLFTNGVIQSKDSASSYFFTRVFVVKKKSHGFVICSEKLQIYSNNSSISLLKQAKSYLESFRSNISLHFPPVIDRKYQISVTPVARRILSKHRSSSKVCSVARSALTQERLSSSSRNEQIHTTTKAVHLVHSKKSTQMWTEERRFSHREEGVSTLRDLTKSVSPLTLNYELPSSPKRRGMKVQPPPFSLQDDRLDTPIEGKLNGKKNAEELEIHGFLEPNCLPVVESPMKIKEEKPFLSVFGTLPEPDGQSIVWDLSKDSILTHMKTYCEVVERMKMDIPHKRVHEMTSNTPWHQRTVYLDNLPRDVHPDSLRRAFETTFGEIEEENGIILCSAKKSSIAYVVFKSRASVISVAQSDAWVTGSKLIIQKYKELEMYHPHHCLKENEMDYHHHHDSHSHHHTRNLSGTISTNDEVMEAGCISPTTSTSLSY